MKCIYQIVSKNSDTILVKVCVEIDLSQEHVESVTHSEPALFVNGIKEYSLDSHNKKMIVTQSKRL